MSRDETPSRAVTTSAKFAITGQRLGKYRLATKLGAGGMGSVYLAYDDAPGAIKRPIAVKLMHPHLSEEKKYVEMFIDEAEIAARLDHPHIVRVLDFGCEQGLYFIAMEYLFGEPLSTVNGILRLTDRPKGHVAAVVRLISDLCEGLHAAHELKSPSGNLMNVVHRDISPQNLFVLYDGTVRLIDFGVARKLGKLHQSTTGVLRGKFAYMAPEQLRAGTIDRRSDVWALGVILWELLAGRQLFEGDSHIESALAVDQQRIPLPSEEDSSIPLELDAIILRALERDPGRRYPTARAFGRELLKFLYKQPEPIGPAEVSEWMTSLFPDGAGRHRVLLQQIGGWSVFPPKLEQVATESIPAALRPPRPNLPPLPKVPPPPRQSLPKEAAVPAAPPEDSAHPFRAAAPVEPPASPAPVAAAANSMGPNIAAAHPQTLKAIDSAPKFDLIGRPVASSAKMTTAVDIREHPSGEHAVDGDDARANGQPSARGQAGRRSIHARPGVLRNYAIVAAGALAVALGIRNYGAFNSGSANASRSEPYTPLATVTELHPALAPPPGPPTALVNTPPSNPTPAETVAAGAASVAAAAVQPSLVAPTVDPTTPAAPVAAAQGRAVAPSIASPPMASGVQRAKPVHVADPATIEPTVAPSTGTVRVMSQAGADVYFAGRRIGHTPLTISLPLGRQELEVRHAGQLTATKVVVQVEPNKPILLSLSPEGQ